MYVRVVMYVALHVLWSEKQKQNKKILENVVFQDH